MPLRREPRLQVGEARRGGELASEVVPRDFQVRPDPRPCLAAENSRAAGSAPVGPGLAGEPEQVTGTFAQTELALLHPERLLDGPHREADLPDPSGPRVHAVHHQVEVRVVPVVVRDDEGLVLPQAEVGEQAVGHADHRRAVHPVGQVEADRQVVDGTR